MAEKKATAKKATETKAAAAKKETVKKAAPKAAKSVLAVNAENTGFKAGDVYQALQQQARLSPLRRLLRLQRFLRRRLFSVSAGSSRRASSLTMERKLHWHKTINRE